ncbi:uncharacterized protein FOMMEDRAFT_152634 [Fomitiporia mediterranea MF3/22]|uniref:uncharacterized protein n=1 Tax=Fomitiporia mediterranea (strain MF3/22) TaxID=694068 RepID=UPI0004407DBD|nr:uncharacterized protein FOMMEDRAFT_152634 [Fomitiporia mediterranea MF3/22]EJD05337.1 hypothetical protein FOMMEDRAFT_152634 [Fomitiporia mediterranea MF3/22]
MRLPPCRVTEDELLEETLARMAFACLVPLDDPGSVTRLVDHLAEQTKRAEERHNFWSSGPRLIHLPSVEMIRKYCEYYAALRFTGIVFRHYFLSRGAAFYVKLLSENTTGFWRELIGCMQHLVQTELTRAWHSPIFEMLYRAVTWDPLLDKDGTRSTKLRDLLICDALNIFES